MSLIEQAAKRLEQLRRAGAETAGATSPPPGPGDDARAGVEHVPTPEAAVRELGARAASAAAVAQEPTVESRSPAATATDTASATATATATAKAAPAAAAPRSPRPGDVLRAPVEAGATSATRTEAADARPARRPPARTGGQPARVEIDLARLKASGFVTPDAPKSQIADEFRVIKRPIIRNAHGASGANVKNGNLVMVTSALPGEGKTFTALNLAISIAMEMDSTVLLVDGDVAHPELPKLLGIPNAPGLLDLLTRDDIDVADALVRTNIEKLAVLPAGSHHRGSRRPRGRPTGG